ncbi:very short patch repair endonuclease [Chloroflexota bacterium]
MTDIVSPEERSQLMSKIRGTDTLIEKKVRSNLHGRGYRFRKCVAGLPGRPDIVLPKFKAVIFIHGCFWHGHADCRKSRLPATRRIFWEEKRKSNVERDTRKVTELLNKRWRVAIVWQCVIEKRDIFISTMDALERWIQTGSRYFEIPAKVDLLNN